MPQVGYTMALAAHKRLQELSTRLDISQIGLIESFLLGATDEQFDQIVAVGRTKRSEVRTDALKLRKTAREALKKMNPADLEAFIAQQTTAVALAK